MAKPKPPPKGGGGQGKGVIDSILSYFKRKDERVPVRGFGQRLKNIAVVHYRGLLGVLFPLCFLSWQGEKGVHSKTVECMWIWMAWFFFIRPVTPPVTGTIPIFLLPMAGVMSTIVTCQCYMNENIMLFVLTGMLCLLLNNSGVDRRIALSIVCSGDTSQFAGERLVFKFSTAAFFLSMFSNKSIVASTLTQYVTKPLVDLQSATANARDTEPNFLAMRNILCNAIQTSSTIGTIGIMHSSYAVLCFRAMWGVSAPKDKEFPDIFNYMQYSLYAFPVALLMFILNFLYHMILINKCIGKPMSNSSMTELRKVILKYKSSVPSRVTLHEKMSVFFLIVALLLFFLRWNKYMDMGWADFSAEKTSPKIPGVKDSTVAAIMVVLLHILPKSFGFLSYARAKKKSQLPPMKPESAILWWKFVDKHTNYGYIFLIGSGVALVVALRETGLGTIVANNLGKSLISNYSWDISLFIVCLLALILPNIMTSVAACVSLLPLVLNLAIPTNPPTMLADEESIGEPVFRSSSPTWALKSYLGALGVGVGTTLGFMSPFPFTSAYFCHETGKVPKRKMALYSIGSSIICLVILWLSLAFYAPFLWDPSGDGITPENAPTLEGAVVASNVTTEAPPAAPPG